MAKQATYTGFLSSDFSDETSSSSSSSSSQYQRNEPFNVGVRKDFIKNYVTDVLRRHEQDNDNQIDLARQQIGNDYYAFKNVPAFQQHDSHAAAAFRTGNNQWKDNDLTSNDVLLDYSSSERVKR